MMRSPFCFYWYTEHDFFSQLSKLRMKLIQLIMIETEKHVLIIEIIPNSKKRTKPVVAIKAILDVKTSFKMERTMCAKFAQWKFLHDRIGKI